MSDVDILRRLTSIESSDDTYTDTVLQTYISTAGGVNAAAAQIWGEKAASLAELTDVAEGNSRRSLGKLYEQALKMASYYGDLAAGPGPAARRGTKVRPIERA